MREFDIFKCFNFESPFSAIEGISRISLLKIILSILTFLGWEILYLGLIYEFFKGERVSTDPKNDQKCMESLQN